MQLQLNANDIEAFLWHNDQCLSPLLSERVDMKQYATKLSRHAIHFVIRHIESELLGFAACYYNDPKSQCGFLSYIGVDQKAWGKGLGAQLMKELIAYGSRHGFKELGLEVDEHNKRAVGFYEKFNFFQAGRGGQGILMKTSLQS